MTGLPIDPSLPHLLVAPVLLPLATAALMLLIGEHRRRTKAAMNIVSTGLGLLLAFGLLAWVDRADATAAFGVYLPGNWPVPIGIVLVLDRLSALMLALTASVAFAVVLYATARWQHGGVYFHGLLQLQLMGLYGAFLTADLFNLFVFFEVLLAASYGLLLHGGGSARVRAGLHYIAINLVASLLFLIGVAAIYGVTGTLNMADIARKLPLLPEGDRGLLHAGATMLAIAFLTKAAAWPLNFWLPPAYAAASAPAAAMFAILTKVGIYAVLRLWSLCFPAAAGSPPPFGQEALVWAGLLTLGGGAIGMLASQNLGRLAGFSVITSSGTLTAALGLAQPGLTGGALYYLASSTLAACALYLLVELVDRIRTVAAIEEGFDDGNEDLRPFDAPPPPEGTNLDDAEQVLTGRPLPAALAFLGLGFGSCALLITGLPPLSGFVGKLTMLSELIDIGDARAWVLFAMLLVSGLLATIGLVRAGMRHFWAGATRSSPRVHLFESLPLALLLGLCVLLALRAETALRYTQATAQALHEPQRYVQAVMSARPVPRPVARHAAPEPRP